MDGRPNRRNKAAFSNSSGEARPKGDKNINAMDSSMNILDNVKLTFGSLRSSVQTCLRGLVCKSKEKSFCVPTSKRNFVFLLEIKGILTGINCTKFLL